MPSEDQLESCAECGATVYPEHLARGAADRWHGKLLCPHCLQEKLHAGQPPVAVLRDPAAAPEREPDNPPVKLVDDDDQAQPSGQPEAPKRSIRAFGGGGITMGQSRADEVRYRRELLPNGPNATRCRTFHSKLNEASLSYLDRQINEWVDSNDEIEIKFATSCIGVFEGKHADPNLIITVFY